MGSFQKKVPAGLNLPECMLQRSWLLPGTSDGPEVKGGRPLSFTGYKRRKQDNACLAELPEYQTEKVLHCAVFS